MMPVRWRYPITPSSSAQLSRHAFNLYAHEGGFNDHGDRCSPDGSRPTVPTTPGCTFPNVTHPVRAMTYASAAFAINCYPITVTHNLYASISLKQHDLEVAIAIGGG